MNTEATRFESVRHDKQLLLCMYSKQICNIKFSQTLSEEYRQLISESIWEYILTLLIRFKRPYSIQGVFN